MRQGKAGASGPDVSKALISRKDLETALPHRYIATKDGQRFLVVLRAPTAVEATIAVQVNWPLALKQ